MKKLFTMIRRGNLEEVNRILTKKPELLSCTAKAPPKKDVGQSPLMVAIKSDNLEVAQLLLDLGADVNFQDEPNPYDPYGLSTPIWLDALGQCYLRAKDTVSERSKARTRQYFQLLCRLLDMGMDPNQKMNKGLYYYAGPPRNAWVAALDEYEHWAVKSWSSYSREREEIQNQQLRGLTKAILDVLLAHGVDIYDFTFHPQEDVTCVLRNLALNRDIREGIRVGREYELKYCPQWFELKWSPMESILRPYYAKDNPYYGAEVSGDRKLFFEQLERQYQEAVKEGA